MEFGIFGYLVLSLVGYLIVGYLLLVRWNQVLEKLLMSFTQSSKIDKFYTKVDKYVQNDDTKLDKFIQMFAELRDFVRHSHSPTSPTLTPDIAQYIAPGAPCDRLQPPSLPACQSDKTDGIPPTSPASSPPSPTCNCAVVQKLEPTSHPLTRTCADLLGCPTYVLELFGAYHNLL